MSSRSRCVTAACTSPRNRSTLASSCAMRRRNAKSAYEAKPNSLAYARRSAQPHARIVESVELVALQTLVDGVGRLCVLQARIDLLVLQERGVEALVGQITGIRRVADRLGRVHGGEQAERAERVLHALLQRVQRLQPGGAAVRPGLDGTRALLQGGEHAIAVALHLRGVRILRKTIGLGRSGARAGGKPEEEQRPDHLWPPGSMRERTQTSTAPIAA